MSDYLAIITLPYGNCWGRNPDKEKAIKDAIRQLKGWGSYLKVADIDINIDVMDVHGHKEVYWDNFGFMADGKKFTPVMELVTRRTPKWR